jgi:hypothetical protein
MSESKTQLHGLKYLCRSDGTVIIEGTSGEVVQDLVPAVFVEIQGKRMTLKEIGGFVQWNGLKIVIPHNVEKIGTNCFGDCKSLCEVIFEFGSNLKEIEGQAFYCSSIKSIEIPNEVDKIGEYCFCLCTSLYGGVSFGSNSNVKEIEEWAFDSCPFKSVEIPRKVEKIGRHCFFRCKSLYDVIFKSGSNASLFVT